MMFDLGCCCPRQCAACLRKLGGYDPATGTFTPVYPTLDATISGMGTLDPELGVVDGTYAIAFTENYPGSGMAQPYFWEYNGPTASGSGTLLLRFTCADGFSQTDGPDYTVHYSGFVTPADGSPPQINFSDIVYGRHPWVESECDPPNFPFEPGVYGATITVTG